MPRVKLPADKRLAQFRQKVPVRSAPKESHARVLERGLRRIETPVDGSCGRLLAFILDHLSLARDGGWLFLVSMRLAEEAAGVQHRQARRCVLRYIRNGVLQPVGAYQPGKPRVYRVHLDA